MVQVIVEIGRPMPDSPSGAAVPLLDTHSTQVEELASSGTSAATTIAARQDGEAAVITNQGASGMVWAVPATAPTAAVETRHPVPAGQSRWIGGLKAGDKIAVIDDS